MQITAPSLQFTFTEITEIENSKVQFYKRQSDIYKGLYLKEKLENDRLRSHFESLLGGYRGVVSKLKKELSKIKLTQKKVVIRQVNIDRMMRIDSNLNTLIINKLLASQPFWNSNCYLLKKDEYGACPITHKVIKYVSIFLNSEYKVKEDTIKDYYGFKPDER